MHTEKYVFQFYFLFFTLLTQSIQTDLNKLVYPDQMQQNQVWQNTEKCIFHADGI